MSWLRVIFRPSSHYISWILNMCCGHQASPQRFLWLLFIPSPLLVFPATTSGGWLKVHVLVTSGNSRVCWRSVSRAPNPVPQGSASHPHPIRLYSKNEQRDKRRGRLKQLTVLSFIYFLNLFCPGVCRLWSENSRQCEMAVPNRVALSA